MFKQFLRFGVLTGALICGLLGTTLNAQITPEDVSKIKTLTSTSISETGDWIVYTINIPADPQKENVGGKQHLYVYNKKTKTQRAYFTAASVSQVTFRPKKGTITFLSRVGSDKVNSLYEIDLNGGEAQKLLTYKTSISSYAWSPNGEQLAIVATEKQAEPKTSLTYKPRFFEENMDERNAYIVTSFEKGDVQKLDIEGAAYQMQWHPNGKMLAISVAPTSSVDDSYMAQQIKFVDVASRKVKTLVNNKGKLGQMAWSPDGQHLLYIGAFDINDPTNGSLNLVSVNGGYPKVIDPNFLGKYEAVEWLNNSEILYLASEGTSSSIGQLSKDGIKRTVLYKADHQHIASFSRSSKGSISMLINSSEHPNELYELENKAKAPQRLTTTNPWLTSLKKGKQEVITYTARDGQFDIQGILIYPLNYKSGEKYPLIVVAHGGPESHYSNGWLTNYSSPGHMGATQDYFVFYPNYRGSTGRGVKFTYSSQGDLAGKEFDDIVDGVDELIKRGLVDKNRVGITGGSYGGYASAWMSTYYSDRFVASVMFVGISNNISKFGTSDIPNEMYLVHERSAIWENWQKQLEVSPIYWVDRAQTPILIMHGAEDPRVHPAQSMELYRHLKVRKPDLPVRLIYYPGEGHGNVNSGSRYDYNVRMMQWFDTYLKTGNRQAPMPSLDLPN